MRVQRLKFVHKVFVRWWLVNKRDRQLRLIMDAIALKLVFRRFRLWSFMTRSYTKSIRMARVCFANWKFYLEYNQRLYEDFARLVVRSKRIPASISIQKIWRGTLERRRWKARRKICRSLFWNSKLWRRINRGRLLAEKRRLEKEKHIITLVASRTTLAIKDYLSTLEGAEDFAKLRAKLEYHYREYDIDFIHDEVLCMTSPNMVNVLLIQSSS